MPGFAYGDSVKTGDGKYILAHFRQHQASVLITTPQQKPLATFSSMKGKQ
jgi:hypothetical protein